MPSTLDVPTLRDHFPALQRTVGDQPAVFLDGPGGTQSPTRVIDIDERMRTIRDLTNASATVGGPRPLVAPMPGLIVRVTAVVGDSVLY